MVDGRPELDSHRRRSGSPTLPAVFARSGNTTERPCRKAVSITELNVVFVTKKGYGRSVLQRDPAVLATLEAARTGSVLILPTAEKAARGRS